MAKHYHVLVGLQGGYMPNVNDVYPTKADAQAGLLWHAEQYRDSEYKVTGSARGGFYNFGEHEYGEVTAACYDDCRNEDDETPYYDESTNPSNGWHSPIE